MHPKTLLTSPPLHEINISSTTGVRANPVTGKVEGHAGVDFAAPMGTPIYAAHDGTVQYIGAASGFGQWIVLKGIGVTTVYGHMANAFDAGLKLNDKVKSGQLISHVGNNGQSTGPHLHFEMHIPTYNDQRTNVVDPLKYMPKIGGKMSVKPDTPAHYGFDISNYQVGFDVKQAMREGFEFAFFKVSEGTSFKDPLYPGFAAAAKAAGILYAGYHFLTTGNARAQAENCFMHLDDPMIPVMVDMEPTGGSRPTMVDYNGFKNELEKLGAVVKFSYIPRWYWEQIGRPDISFVPNLVASNYVSGEGYASILAQQVSRETQMSSYGGANPVILQFTDKGKVAGYTIDCDIFYGSLSDLKTMFQVSNYTIPTPTTGTSPRGSTTPLTQGFFTSYMQPVASDVKDIRYQLTGSRDSIKGDLHASYPGFPQLNDKTLVDYIAELGTKIDNIGKVVAFLYDKEK